MERSIPCCGAEEKLSALAGSLGGLPSDPQARLDVLTALAGRLLGADCAVYNRWERGRLVPAARWNVPPAFTPPDRPGRLSHDVFMEGGDQAVLIASLAGTAYAESDPNVKAFGLGTYFGQPVRSGRERAGILCAVFMGDFVPGEADRRLLSAAASIIGLEEERRATAAALKRQTAALEASMDGIGIVDEEGRFIYLNPAMARLFGYDGPEELLGRSWEALYDPSELRRFRDEILPAFARSGRWRGEAVGLRRDGALVPEELSMSALDGGGLVCIDRDITERLTAEEELRWSEEKYRLVFAAESDALVVFDGESLRVLDVNEAAVRLFGYTPDEFRALTVVDLSAEPQKTLPAVKEVAEGRIRRIAFRLQRKKDGSIFPAEIGAGSFSFKGRRMGLGAIRDITERRKAEEALEKARGELEGKVAERTRDLEAANSRLKELDRLKSEFVAGMSHELRTPLNSIIGFSELLHEGLAGKLRPAQREHVGDVLRSARHLSRLINDVLDLAKVEAGKVDVELAPVALGPLVGEAVKALRPLAVERGIRLRIDRLRGPVRAVSDASKLKQILYNYLSNALKFTPAGGTVTVRALPAARGRFRLEVRDTGPGLGREEIAQLFVPFGRLGTKADGSVPGTGLGLALTKRLAEALGGRVGVSSSPGRGSLFFAELPGRARAAAPRVSAPDGRLRRSARRPARRSAGRVLVVEDHPESRNLARILLEAEGYQTRCAADGKELFASLEGFRPDLILMDLQLPGEDGLELARRLKSVPATRDIPVVALTARAMRGDEEKALEAGCDGYIAKPYDPRDLLRRVSRAAAKGRGRPPR